MLLENWLNFSTDSTKGADVVVRMSAINIQLFGVLVLKENLKRELSRKNTVQKYYLIKRTPLGVVIEGMFG